MGDGGFRRSGDSSRESEGGAGWRRGSEGGERVRDFRFIDRVEVEGFRWRGDKVLFLWSRTVARSKGFLLSGEMVWSLPSLLSSCGAVFNSGKSLVRIMAESRASIISEVRSIERPLA